MRPYLLAIAITIALPLQTTAAEIKVLCVGGVQPAIAILVPQFERASGYKVSVDYVSPGGALRDRVLADRDVDVAFVPSPVLADIDKAGKIIPGSRVEIARTPLAVGVRAGAAKPDLSTPEAVKRAVIAAKSIALSDPKANSPIGSIFIVFRRPLWVRPRAQIANGSHPRRWSGRVRSCREGRGRDDSDVDE